jgi:hypothetical protein
MGASGTEPWSRDAVATGAKSTIKYRFPRLICGGPGSITLPALAFCLSVVIVDPFCSSLSGYFRSRRTHGCLNIIIRRRLIIKPPSARLRLATAVAIGALLSIQRLAFYCMSPNVLPTACCCCCCCPAANSNRTQLVRAACTNCSEVHGSVVVAVAVSRGFSARRSARATLVDVGLMPVVRWAVPVSDLQSWRTCRAECGRRRA